MPTLTSLLLNQMATTYDRGPNWPNYESNENPLKSTIHLLDSLVAFYQHERMWVYHTRAKLEEAFPNPSIMDPSTIQSIPASSSPPARNDETLPNETVPSHQSRWTRRKKGFKLRLNGIRFRPRRVISAIPVDHAHPREQLLEMFEKMMETRMESCQRINKLVRDANRHYH